MNAVLEQRLCPPRLLLRAFDDLHRIADAAVSAAATMRALREEAVELRAAVGPFRDDMDALRGAFAGADAELEALRRTFVPEVRGVHEGVAGLQENVEKLPAQLGALGFHLEEIGNRLANELASFNATTQVVVREADQMRQVVEPLQSATDRVGRVADKLPDGGS